MSRRHKVYRLLGLARRAGAVAPGIQAVRQAVRAGEARLVLMAEDGSEAQLAKVRRTLRERAIPRVHLGDRDALGAAIGFAPVSAIAVTSATLAEQVLNELDAHEATGGLLAVEG